MRSDIEGTRGYKEKRSSILQQNSNLLRTPLNLVTHMLMRKSPTLIESSTRTSSKQLHVFFLLALLLSENTLAINSKPKFAITRAGSKEFVLGVHKSKKTKSTHIVLRLNRGGSTIMKESGDDNETNNSTTQSVDQVVVDASPKQSSLAKILSTIFPIQPKEVKKFLLMGAIKFFVIMALTLTRDTKDTLVVTQCGAEAIAFLKVCRTYKLFL